VKPPRTVVVFESGAFNTSEPRPYFINPNCYGDDVARWLAAALPRGAVEVVGEPEQEDFGWYLDLSVDALKHFFVLGYRPGDAEHEGVWIGEIERPRGLIRFLFGRRDVGVDTRVVSAIHEVLSTSSDVHNVVWHYAADFKAGRESNPSSTP